MVNINLIIIGSCLLLFGIFSRLLQKKLLSLSMLLVTTGIIIGPLGLDWFTIDIKSDPYRTTAELALVLLLFIEASKMNLRNVFEDYNLFLRLLIALPLKIAAVAFIAFYYFPGLDLYQAAILAAVVSLTDISLVKTVLSKEIVPSRIRQTLTIESSLTDGLTIPLLLLLISLATSQQTLISEQWFEHISFEIVLGPFIGIGLGYFGGQLIRFTSKKHYINDSLLGLMVIGIAVLVYTITEVIHGNGFIATFAAGLMLGNTARDICHKLYEFDEAEVRILKLAIFFIFGAIMVPVVVQNFNQEILIFSVLAVTIARIIPIFISLIGAGFRIPAMLFMGWFGPKGLSSILFGILLVETSGIQGADGILSVILTTVLISVYLHALTAKIGAVWYERYLKKHVAKHSKAESKKTQDIPAHATIL